MNTDPSSTSSAKDETSKALRKELVEGLTAAAFLALSIGAILFTILNWNWK